MQVNLFNSKNPNGKRVPVTVTIEQPDLMETKDGEVVYIIGLYTGAFDINGLRISPTYINNVTKNTLQDEIKRGLTILAEQIDWGALEADNFSPVILDLLPVRGDDNVNMEQDVFIILKDPFPASFIDTSTLSFKVNDIDVTSEVSIVEKNNQVTLHWIPTRIRN